MIPALASSAAMCRAEEPGLSCTSSCCVGPAGRSRPYASRAPATSSNTTTVLNKNFSMNALYFRLLYSTSESAPRSHLPALRASRMVNELPASVLLLPHQHSSTWTNSLRQMWPRRMLENASRLHKALQDQHRRHAVHSLDAALRADLIF